MFLAIFQKVSWSGRWATYALLPAILLCQLPCVLRSDEPKAGEIQTLTFRGADGKSVTLRFAYCPRGEMILLDANRQQRKVNTSGFYLTEAEITQTEFATVLKSAKLAHVKKQYADVYKDDADAKFTTDGHFPILGTLPQDATDFCLALQKADAGSSKNLNLITRTFRIPTQYEWQYACRAGTEHPHFSSWPAPADWQTLPVYQKGIKSNTPLGQFANSDELKGFDGSQKSIVKLLAGYDRGKGQQRDLEDAFNSLLKAALKMALPTDSDNWARALVKIPPYTSNEYQEDYKNRWNLRRMHDNVSEWVLDIHAPEEFDTKWRAWTDFVQQKKGDGTEFLVAGGNFDADNWWRFSIQDWQYQDRCKMTSTDAFNLPNKCVGQKVGIRVLMEQSVVRDYLVAIRSFSTRERVDSDALKKLLDFAEEIPKREKSNGEAARARIDFYRAVATYRSGDVQEAQRILQQAQPQLAKEDPFFALVRMDAAGQSKKQNQ